MPRRSSPRASRPVRSPSPKSSSKSSGGWFSSGRNNAPRATAMPAPPPPRPGMQQGRQGSDLMGQMAATAGGVAIGSAMGHYITDKMRSGEESIDQNHDSLAPQNQMQPCEFEWKKFLECTQTQQDLSQCQVFNDMFKRCQTQVMEKNHEV